METIEMLSKNLEEIRLIENNTALNNESMRTPDKSQPRESFRNIQGKQEELLKKNNELEKDLYDLQIAEETRYHSLYQLEKQNAHVNFEKIFL